MMFKSSMLLIDLFLIIFIKYVIWEIHFRKQSRINSTDRVLLNTSPPKQLIFNMYANFYIILLVKLGKYSFTSDKYSMINFKARDMFLLHKDTYNYNFYKEEKIISHIPETDKYPSINIILEIFEDLDIYNNKLIFQTKKLILTFTTNTI